MNQILTAIAKIFGKVVDNVQGRIERLKNEKAELEKQLSKLHKQDSTPANITKAQKIETRISDINRILYNNAKD